MYNLPNTGYFSLNTIINGYIKHISVSRLTFKSQLHLDGKKTIIFFFKVLISSIKLYRKNDTMVHNHQSDGSIKK